MTQQVYISDTNIWIDFRNAGLLAEAQPEAALNA